MSQQNVEIVTGVFPARDVDMARLFRDEEEVIDLGAQVLVLVRDYGRRDGSTKEVALDGAPLCTCRDGRKAAELEA